jgi:hypothetical protein
MRRRCGRADFGPLWVWKGTCTALARLLEPAAKLATARMLDPATASHSLGEMLGLGKVAAKEVYAALDWLGREQPFIEAQLACRHMKDGALLTGSRIPRNCVGSGS